MKYPPLFERIFTNKDKEGKNIALAQKEFEVFWRKIQKLCPNNPEKSLAMRRMQESSMWFTRAIAASGFVSDDETVQKPVRHEAYTRQEETAKPNKTTIILKRKKEY